MSEEVRDDEVDSDSDSEFDVEDDCDVDVAAFFKEFAISPKDWADVFKVNTKRQAIINNFKSYVFKI